MRPDIRHDDKFVNKTGTHLHEPFIARNDGHHSNSIKVGKYYKNDYKPSFFRGKVITITGAPSRSGSEGGTPTQRRKINQFNTDASPRSSNEKENENQFKLRADVDLFTDNPDI